MWVVSHFSSIVTWNFIRWRNAIRIEISKEHSCDLKKFEWKFNLALNNFEKKYLTFYAFATNNKTYPHTQVEIEEYLNDIVNINHPIQFKRFSLLHPLLSSTSHKENVNRCNGKDRPWRAYQEEIFDSFIFSTAECIVQLWEMKRKRKDKRIKWLKTEINFWNACVGSRRLF